MINADWINPFPEFDSKSVENGSEGTGSDDRPLDTLSAGIPRIAILMAVYNPNISWLRQQLRSLNEQTWPNLCLYIRDDASAEALYERTRKTAEECITAFPYFIERNPVNLGRNTTFEVLTGEAEADYFAFCDQDDIWLPEKLTVLMDAVKKEDALLVCSDMYIIDEKGRTTADSITKKRRHQVFQSGDHLAPKLLVSNFASGCTILMDAETAQEAVPFCPDMYYDQYLAFYAARLGRVVSLPDRLIRYRIHSSNQTLVMGSVHCREDYVRVQIDSLIRRLRWLQEKFGEEPELKNELNDCIRWAEARRGIFSGDKGASRTVIRNRRFSPGASWFDVIFGNSSEKIFMYLIGLVKKNVL